MRNLILFFILSSTFKLFTSELLANEDATYLFTKAVVEEALQVKEDYWLGEDLQQPPGGYLFRFSLDITDDGKEEIFLKTSAKDFGRQGQYWNIYQMSSEGNYQLLAKDVSLKPKFGMSRYTDHTEITTIRGTTRYGLGFMLYKYTFDKEGNFKKSEQKISMDEYHAKLENKNQDWEKIMGAQTQYYATNLERILLFDFLKNPNHPWHSMNYVDLRFVPDRAVEVHENGGRGYKDPELENDKERAKNFTPQEAQQLIEKWKQKESKTNNPPPKTSFIPFNQTQTNLSSQTTLEKKSSKQIIIWSIIGILGFGLVTIFIFKKRT